MRKGAIFCSNKGNVFDMLTVVIILIVLAISLPFIFKMFADWNTEIQADDDLGTDAKEVSQNWENRGYAVWDGAFLFLFVFLWIGVIIASFMIDAHPIFFVVSLVLMIFMLIVVAELGNLYDEVISQDSDLTVTVAKLPIMNWIATHILLVAVLISFSIMITLYGKQQVQ